MTPLLATNRATVFQLAEYQILCGKPRFNSKAPSWTNTRGLKKTEESLPPSFWHLQIVRLSQLSLFWIARGERNVIAWKAWPKGAREALVLPLTVLLSITIPIAAMKHTYQLRARYAQHLKHAQNHITRAVAAMDSCCARGTTHLIGDRETPVKDGNRWYPFKASFTDLILSGLTCFLGRQRDRVVSASDSQSGGPGSESRSTHLLDLFLVVPSSNPRPRL